MLKQFPLPRKLLIATLLSSSLIIAGCGGDDSDDDSTLDDSVLSIEDIATSEEPLAIVSTRSTGFDAGDISIFSTTAPYRSALQLAGSGSDIRVRTLGDDFFVLAGFGTSTLTRYNLAQANTATLQLSVNGSDPDANPHDLIFVNDQKAYLLRYGASEIWVINPSANDETDFLLSTIDLSAYDTDGIPNMHRGVIVDDKLFVLLQRLNDTTFEVNQPAYVAVIDTATDTEINTGTGDLPGIELSVRNPVELSVDPATSDIFIAAVGRFGFEGFSEAEYTGGIATVNTSDFSTQQLVDDSAEVGQFVDVEVIDTNKAYAIIFQSASENRLVELNPNTGDFSEEAVAGLDGVDLESLSIGPNGNLWVGIVDPVNPRIAVINPTDNTLSAEIPMTFNTQNIVFTD